MASLSALLSLLVLGCSCQPDPEPAAPAAPPPPRVERELATDPPLVAVGDVGPESAVIQVETQVLTRVMVEAWVAEDPEGPRWKLGPLEPEAPPKAPTVQEVLEGLPPSTEIAWRVRTGDDRSAEGRFRTAPLPDTRAPVSLVVGGDLGGQGWCRPLPGDQDTPGGYRIFDAMGAVDPDLAVLNGDMIYADGACAETDPGGAPVVTDGHPGSVLDVDWTDRHAVREVFDGWWRYNRSDPAVQAFLADVPVVVGWDDHEVVNDFGLSWDRWHTGDAERPGYRIMAEAGRSAFLDWNPIRPGDASSRLERRMRWGHHVDLFVTDARAHRSQNGLPDGPDKHLLGARQLDRLLAGLEDSDATWKIVSVSVPMSIPTGSDAWKNGRDGWASGTGDPTTPEGEDDTSARTGFERELGALLGGIREAGVTGVVFVTTDVHHSRLLSYDNGGVPVHEVVSGPLRAWSGQPGPLDPTFSPVEHYAEGEVFTFAHLAVDEAGTLTITIRGEDGEIRPGGTLTLPPPTGTD